MLPSLFLSSLLLLLLPALAQSASTDPLASISQAHSEESDKAQQAFAASLTKADERAVKTLAAAATAAQRSGDLAACATAWKEVLRLERDHAEARAFFTAAGSLDTVLTEVAERRPVPQPGALPTRLPGNARALTIGAAPGAECDLGAQPAGTIVVVQYVSGTWAVGYSGAADVQTSPDAATANQFQHLVIVDLGEQPAKVLAVVPPGTKDRVFAFQLGEDARKLALAIAPGPLRRMQRNSGVVPRQVV